MKKLKDKKPKEQKKKGLAVRSLEWNLRMLDFISPLSLVAIRIYVALVFWRSGLTKLPSWDNTIFLFETEYMTHKKITLFGNQILTPETAAFGGTFAELVFPILLIIGFGSRLSAFALLIMTAVIQFTYASSEHHLVWALMLFVILTLGAGRASWDYFIKSSFYGTIDNTSIREKLFAILCTLLLSLYATFLIFTDVIQMQ